MNPSHQCGASLIEALVALFMSACGSLALLGWQQQLQTDREAMQQQSMAMEQAQDALESFHATPSHQLSHAASQRQTPQGITLQMTVTRADDAPSVGPSSAQLLVQVQWQDRLGRSAHLTVPAIQAERHRNLEALLPWRARLAQQASPIDTLPSPP